MVQREELGVGAFFHGPVNVKELPNVFVDTMLKLSTNYLTQD